jgi:glycine cleavage system H protein
LAVNGKVVEDPETINEEPYDEGWLIRVRLSDAGELDELLDADAYRKLLESL